MKRIVYTPKAKYTSGSSCLILNKDNTQVLLIKRRDIPAWQLPSGGKNNNESFRQAAQREAQEETSCKIKVIKKIAQYERGSTPQTIHLYLGKIISGTPKQTPETKTAKFFNIKNLPIAIDPYSKIMIDNFIQSPNMRTFTLPKRHKLVNPTFLLKHPLVVIRYLLVIQGIHINT